MPKSNYGGKRGTNILLKRLHQVMPLKHIVDVGPGVGTYAQFRREGQQWTGVEVWGPYVTKYELEKKYDRIVVCDVRYLDWSKLAPINVVIFGDILEHMTKSDALATLDAALQHAQLAIISLPVIFSDQGELEGNPYETHVKGDWTHEEALASFPDWCMNIRQSYIGVYYVCRDPLVRRTLVEIGTTLKAQLVGEKHPEPDPLVVTVRQS